MSTWTLKFGSASILDFFHGWRAEGETAGAGFVATAPAKDPQVSQRRSEAMRGFFPKLAAWYSRRSYESEMRAIDAYLSQAANLADLENRIRCLERQRSSGFWN
jgi:hypothetical protein